MEVPIYKTVDDLRQITHDKSKGYYATCVLIGHEKQYFCLEVKFNCLIDKIFDIAITS